MPDKHKMLQATAVQNAKGPHWAGLSRLFLDPNNYAKAHLRLALLFALLLMLPTSTAERAMGAALSKVLVVAEVMGRLKQIRRTKASLPAHGNHAHRLNSVVGVARIVVVPRQPRHMHPFGGSFHATPNTGVQDKF